MLRVVTDDEGRAESPSALDEIVLEGARRMLAAALEAVTLVRSRTVAKAVPVPPPRVTG